MGAERGWLVLIKPEDLLEGFYILVEEAHSGCRCSGLERRVRWQISRR